MDRGTAQPILAGVTICEVIDPSACKAPPVFRYEDMSWPIGSRHVDTHRVEAHRHT